VTYIALKNQQKYISTGRLVYTGGTENIDVSEIYSSFNLSKTLEKLNLSSENLDELRQGIEVVEIWDDEAIQKVYEIRCTMGKDYSEEFSARFLYELLNTYFSNYGDYKGTITNPVNDILSSEYDYDYIEMMEYIDKSLEETVWALDELYENSDNFRASATGYTFSDLSGGFETIKETEVDQIICEIIADKISKNPEKLVEKYENKIKEYNLLMENYDSLKADISEIMDEYTEKITSNQSRILSNTYTENAESDNIFSQYDKLLTSWLDVKNEYDFTEIDVTYCQYIIDTFSENSNNNGTSEILENEISAVVDKISSLYDMAQKTENEYNEYLSAKSVRMASGISTTEQTSVGLYTAVMAIFYLILGTFASFIILRTKDIIYNIRNNGGEHDE
jgi:hypothetical protein